MLSADDDDKRDDDDAARDDDDAVVVVSSETSNDIDDIRNVARVDEAIVPSSNRAPSSTRSSTTIAISDLVASTLAECRLLLEMSPLPASYDYNGGGGGNGSISAARRTTRRGVM